MYVSRLNSAGKTRFNCDVACTIKMPSTWNSTIYLRALFRGEIVDDLVKNGERKSIVAGLKDEAEEEDMSGGECACGIIEAKHGCSHGHNAGSRLFIIVSACIPE